MNIVTQRLTARVLIVVLLATIMLAATNSTKAANSAEAIGCKSLQIESINATFSGCHFAGERNSAESTARSFLTTYADSLNFDSGTVAEMALIEVKHGLASSHTRLQQVVAGYPVFGGLLTVSQGPDGAVQTLHSSYVSELNVGDVSAERAKIVSVDSAEQHAMQAANVAFLRHNSPARLVWFPSGDKAILAWELTIYGADTLGDFLTVVNAATGDILFQEDRIAYVDGSGMTYEPNPYQTQGSGTGLNDSGDSDSAALTAQRINVTLERLDAGTGLLKGEWVDLSTLNSTTLPDVDANELTRVYDYTRSDARFEQVVIYHSVDQISEWFHDLGFDDDAGMPNGIRDFPTLANAHWYNQDQSFYSTGDDAIHFGDGGVDDGEDADIVAHEYGHAIQHNQNASWGGGQMGAMGEGFGDFLAASFYDADGDAAFQAANAPCVGEWDAVSYDNGNPPCLRRVDGNKMYPDDLVNQVHADGEIWSRALWDIHNSIGRDMTMQIVLEHHFGLPGSSTMPTAAAAMLTANNNLNGLANDMDIRTAFCDRGILTGNDCMTPTAVSLSSTTTSTASMQPLALFTVALVLLTGMMAFKRAVKQ